MTTERRFQLSLVVSFALAVGFVVFFFTSEAASEVGFGKITDGMTEKQVKDELGSPFHEWHVGNGSARYFYGGFLKCRWCSMEVFFDGHGRVTGKFHDH